MKHQNPLQQINTGHTERHTGEHTKMFAHISNEKLTKKQTCKETPRGILESHTREYVPQIRDRILSKKHYEIEFQKTLQQVHT